MKICCLGRSKRSFLFWNAQLTVFKQAKVRKCVVA